MSDLSQPPLSLVPSADGPPVADDDRATVPAPLEDMPVPPPAPRRATIEVPTSAPSFWPMPPLPCYAADGEKVGGQPCQVEGLNGKATVGRLMAFDLEAGCVRLAVPHTRSLMTLRFDQFRRLRLSRPLAALPAAGAEAADSALSQRPAVPFHMQLVGGGQIEGLTLSPLDTEAGVFLFEPLDLAGTVRRSFVPRAACTAIELGQRLGDTLVEQQMASAEQVDAALGEQQQLRSQRLGDILVVRQIILAEELDAAIEQQARMPMVRIGEALMALGFVTESQLTNALEQQKTDRSVPLGELLVRKGLVSRSDLQTALARKMGYPLVDVTQFAVETAAAQRVPYAVATRLPALPLMMRGGRLVVALEDPTKSALIDELEFAARVKVVPVLARTGSLLGAIDRAYERIGGVDFAQRGSQDPSAGVDFDMEDAGKLLATLEQQQQSAETRVVEVEEPPIEQSDNSLVRLINSMILEAQAQGVSDIHIEAQPGREKVRIRFRKDGLLRPYMELPHTYRSALVARLKIMCDLDISEKRKPQDGKINFSKFVQNVKLELRVATIPTNNGCEDVVLRLLASAKPLPMDKIGLSPGNFTRLRDAIERPYGMVLCVGPTGSGKTTTLHSALGWINTPERKIWTAEDPIEITQSGLRQVQVNARIDWTFAKALRAFLRADPDVVMVGEIRDKETAQMAVEASLTGHLVLSTLHTNSAPETVTRLLDMGMDPFNFADALLAVLAQRLVRRLCTDCRVARDATAQEVEELLHDHQHVMAGAEGVPGEDTVLADWMQRFGHDGRLRLHGPAGCARCDRSGYRGRTALHELMTVTRPMRHLIQTGARAEELQRQGFADGLRTLRQDGIEKVLQGMTTLEEVRAASN